MADELGSYIISFYIIGGIMVLAAAFPFLLLCPRCQKDGVEKVEIFLHDNEDECGECEKENVFYISTL